MLSNRGGVYLDNKGLTAFLLLFFEYRIQFDMEENQSFLELQVNQETTTNITEVSRWSKFFAVMVLVGFGLVVLMFMFLWGQLASQFLTVDEMQSGDANMALGVIIVVLLITAAIVVILMSFLLKAANRLRNGIRNRDQVLFNSGLANLKNYFAMYGVLGILGLLFSLLGLLN